MAARRTDLSAPSFEETFRVERPETPKVEEPDWWDDAREEQAEPESEPEATPDKRDAKRAAPPAKSGLLAYNPMLREERLGIPPFAAFTDLAPLQ